MQAAKALYFIFQSYRIVLNKSGNKNKLFFEFKELVVDTVERTKYILGFEKVLNVFNISSQTYYYWKNKIVCKSSVLNLCKIRHPQQLTLTELKKIKQYLTDKQYFNWSLASVYYKMLKEKSVYMSLVSFYKYAKLLKLTRQKPSHRRKKHKIGIRAEKPLQICACRFNNFQTA